MVHVYRLAAGCHPELVDSLQEAVALAAYLIYLMEDFDGAILPCVAEVPLL